MPDTTFADLLTLLLADVEGVAERTDEQTGVRLQVTSLDVQLPTRLWLREEPPPPGQSEPVRRLMLVLPASRETPAPGRTGRLSFSVSLQPSNPTPPSSSPQEP